MSNKIKDAQPLLQIKSLTITTNTEEQLVKPISFSLYRGKNLTILGETGSGKSLLIQAIMGILPDNLTANGAIFKENDEIKLNSDMGLWGKWITMLPQEPKRSLDPIMDIYSQLWETFHYVAQFDSHSAQQASNQSLTHIGLTQSQKNYPYQLSGGMAQRAAFAITHAAGAQILLADEPTKGLDEANKDTLIHLLKQVPQQQGSLLTITHDIDLAEQLGGEILVLKNGELVEQGAANDVLHNPQHSYTQALLAANPKYWTKAISPLTAQKPLLLSVDDIKVTRAKQVLFEHLSFNLKRGEILGVMGESGIGKSTLADVLCGLLKPTSGKMTWYSKQHKKHQVLKLYQDPPEAFAPQIPLKILLDDIINKHHLDRSQIPELLDQLSLSADILARTAENVSGGELQRVAILRALLLDPVLLIADEATSRLDLITQQETIALLIQQCKQRQSALVIISHDQNLIEKSCDKVIDLAQFKPKTLLT